MTGARSDHGRTDAVAEGDPGRDALARATRYRILALLLRPPEVGRQAELAELVGRPPDGGGSRLARLLGSTDREAMEEGFRLHGQGGPISLCASDFLQEGVADKGPVLGDIAGFYKAFGFEPTLKEPPDHFSTLYEFAAFLALKEAWAVREGRSDQAEIARDAEGKFLELHVLSRIGPFAEKLLAHAPEGGVWEAVAEELLTEL